MREFCLPEPPSRDGLPRVWVATADAPGGLCDYQQALNIMNELSQRPATAPDVILAVEHPPIATLGRAGGRDSLVAQQYQDAQGQWQPLDVVEVGRGGKVTMHAPGQLVVYPVVHLPSLEPPIGRGPLGDLPAYARLLEEATIATCSQLGLPTFAVPGKAGVWVTEQRKIMSLGVGVQRGWSQHGLALNVNPHLPTFAAMVPCGLGGVELTSLQRELDLRGLPCPSLPQVREVLVAWLRPRLRRVAGLGAVT